MNILTTGMGWIDHTPGGLNRYFADYVKAMTQQGHSIRAYITAGGEKTSAPEYVEEVLREQGRKGTLDRVRAFRQAVGSRDSRWTPQVYNPHFALYASLIGRGQLPRGIPIVTHFHGPWARESMVEDRGASSGQQIRYRMKKTVEKLAYNRSDKFVVLSGYFQTVLEQEYGVASDRIHRIPGAVDTDRFRPADNREQIRRELGFADGDRVLFCIRRLVRRMGIDRLIRAMAKVKSDVPGAKLVIAGDGTMRSELERLTAELGLGDSVRFVGRVSNEDLVRWYQAADFSIVPTVTLEGFGLVTVESLACGTPVLGTRTAERRKYWSRSTRSCCSATIRPKRSPIRFPPSFGERRRAGSSVLPGARHAALHVAAGCQNRNRSAGASDRREA
ncbi:glycosyltransferase family 4 protein [Cohnella faecalis]|uniref:glycosyltransferase family 4 protein n=1 Tax=Cohnella faecalis TaxID=2315694 RepID=UPI001F37D3EC|nr:glycosyltransferase family 4 protein [Cohnella faecalis]